jgi:hypothetical protein
MWIDVQNDLASILSSRLFPALASDPGYRLLLHNAGITSIFNDGAFRQLHNKAGIVEEVRQAQVSWSNLEPMKHPPKDTFANHRRISDLQPRLNAAAQMCAKLMFMNVEASRSLRERRAKALVLEGPLTLYRIWDSSSDKDRRNWNWWFSEGLWNLAIAKSESVNQPTRDWLRDKLAVSFSFNKFDQVSKMTIRHGQALPAIEAMGLPMPHYMRPIDREIPKDYWEKFGSVFEGGKTQYFLPFASPDTIVPWHFPS